MPPQNDSNTQELTAADAAKLVFREVPKFDKEGNPAGTTQKSIGADEVFAWKDYGDHVVVVTVDGQKFSGEKKAAK